MPKGQSYIQPASRTDYETPHDFFDNLHRKWRFNVDPCCTPDQHSAQEILKKGRDGKILIPPPSEGIYAITTGEHTSFDGLLEPWTDRRGKPGRVYMNPPYGLALRAWTDKAVAEVRNGNALFVVGLVPVKTDTQWWQRNVIKRLQHVPSVTGWWSTAGEVCDVLTEVYFIKGRLTFHGTEQGAGHASAIVVWQRG